ncbi:ribonuclease E/G [Candidatus Nesciobacter abundans]|uniref:Ribonuclease G n=1 Tax=Candidatus Nesciobacter abundans TaxID=2601668 RepID=A0A5C0UH59_9PROT|nr:ribonuclease E/G [Candidatus Nesciobacter abundans]QEK39070.1 hypothetical protein FZC36_01300 [Candidatus Nesciobacter abundans]
MKSILIDASDEKNLQVAIKEEERLVHFFYESNDKKSIIGNIYLGQVDHVEHSLQAYFINYGNEKNGFLPFSHAFKVLRKGEFIAVQVTKDEKDNKGVTLTSFVEIKTLLMIFVANKVKNMGISKKITSLEKREILQNWFNEKGFKESLNVIFRKESEDENLEALDQDCVNVQKILNTIEESYSKKEIHLIREEFNLAEKIIRDYYKKNTEIHIEGHLKIKDIIKNRIKIKPHKDKQPIFEKHEIMDQIEALYSDRINLPCGGYIKISYTEALTAIDINSGSCKKVKNIDENSLLVNLEAAEEIAHQIQLRDIGGLIVIDFIDMNSSSNEQMLEETIKLRLENDKAKFNVGNIDKFGLLSMSRQQIRTNILRSTHSKCSSCKGIGFLKLPSIIVSSIIKNIRIVAVKDGITKIIVGTRQEILTHILNSYKEQIFDIERSFNINIEFVQSNHNFQINYLQNGKLIEHDHEVIRKINEGKFALKPITYKKHATENLIKTNEFNRDNNILKEDLGLGLEGIDLENLDHANNPNKIEKISDIFDIASLSPMQDLYFEKNSNTIKKSSREKSQHINQSIKITQIKRLNKNPNEANVYDGSYYKDTNALIESLDSASNLQLKRHQ